jgi:hypothetical protein
MALFALPSDAQPINGGIQLTVFVTIVVWHFAILAIQTLSSVNLAIASQGIFQDGIEILTLETQELWIAKQLFLMTLQ